MEKPSVDPTRYGELLAQVRPGIIETPEEHERLLGIAENLMEQGDAISPEQEKLLALVVLLVEAYEVSIEAADDDDEEQVGDHAPPQPFETLQRLMTARKLQFDDVAPLFGKPQFARDVLAGKRQISRGEAKELGRYFQVPPKLFFS